MADKSSPSPVGPATPPSPASPTNGKRGRPAGSTSTKPAFDGLIVSNSTVGATRIPKAKFKIRSGTGFDQFSADWQDFVAKVEAANPNSKLAVRGLLTVDMIMR